MKYGELLKQLIALGDGLDDLDVLIWEAWWELYAEYEGVRIDAVELAESGGRRIVRVRA